MEFIVIGGVAAVAHGSPYATVDVDVVPRSSRHNLGRLSMALRDLDARVHVSPSESVRFQPDAQSLADAATWNLTTRHGGLDIAFTPSGTNGYTDLVRGARDVDLGGFVVKVASLADIIRSKEAAGRERDRVVLPALRRLLELSEATDSSG